MPGRTPSFVVVGLVIVLFLLGFFYLSCSSKNTELQQTVEEFEQRLHSLNMRNDDFNRQIESMNTNKRTLEEEILYMKKEIHKKDDRLDELSSKLNEQISQLQKLSFDKGTLDDKLADYRNLSALLALRDQTIVKLEQQLNDQKQSDEDRILQLRQQLNTNKQEPNNNLPIIPNQRFKPLLSHNETVDDSLLRKPLEKLNNIAGQLKDKARKLIVSKDDGAEEVARGPSDNDPKNPAQPNPDLHQRLQRSLNDPALDKNNRAQLKADVALQTVNLTSNGSKIADENHRIGNRESFRDAQHVDQAKVDENVDADFDEEEPNRELQRVQRVNV